MSTKTKKTATSPKKPKSTKSKDSSSKKQKTTNTNDAKTKQKSNTKNVTQSELPKRPLTRRARIARGIVIPGGLVALVIGVIVVSGLSIGDIGGNGNTSSIPMIACNHQNNTIIANGNFAFTVTSASPVASFRLFDNGSSDSVLLSEPYEYSTTVIGTGKLSLQIVVIDSLKNRNVSTFNFIYDTIEPLIGISPTDGSTTSDNGFNITIIDNHFDNATVVTDSFDQVFTNSPIVITNPWSTAGMKLIAVTAFDRAGNRKDGSFTLNFSQQAPTVDVDSPTNSSSITINIHSKYTSAVLVGNTTSSMVKIKPPYTTGMIVNMNWSSDGIKSLVVFVNDTVDNHYWINKTVYFDVSPPIVGVSPSNGSVVSAINLSFTVTDSNPYSIFVNNTNITHSLTYAANVTADGYYHFVVYAIDSIGNSERFTLLYIIHNIKPSFTVSPTNGSFINASTSLHFTVIQSLPLSYSATVNGTNIKPSLIYSPSLSINGITHFQVVITDSLGLTNTSMLVYTFDNILPVISISPVNNSIVMMDAFNVTVADTNFAWMTIVTDSYNQYFITSIAHVINPWAVTGMKTITVTAADLAGNKRISIFKLNFSQPTPYLYAPTPTNSSIVHIFNLSPYTSYVMIGPNVSSMVKIHSPYNNNVTINMNWSSDGIKSIIAFVNDTVGDHYWLNATVQYDTTLPTFTVSPKNGSIVSSLSFTFTMTDVHPYKLFVNGSDISNTLIYSSPATINGLYHLTIVTIDTSWNVNHSTLVYTLDTIVPVITLLYKTNNTGITDPVLSFNVTDVHLSVVKGSKDNIHFNVTMSQAGSIYSVNLSSYFVTEKWYDFYIKANDTIGNVAIKHYRFLWNVTGTMNFTVIYPSTSSIPVYKNPTALANFTTNNGVFLGYFNQSKFSRIDITLSSSTANYSSIAIDYFNITNSETSYNQATMYAEFVKLKLGSFTNDPSFKNFSTIGSMIRLISTAFLNGNCSWRICLLYRDTFNNIGFGFFTLVYDDKTPTIYWTSQNHTTLYIDRNQPTTYINFTINDQNLNYANILVKITNTTGTFTIYNVTLSGAKTVQYVLGFYNINSTVPYTLNVWVHAVDKAGNVQDVHLQWTVTIQRTSDRNSWNSYITLGVAALVIFGLLGFALKRSRNNGSHVGGT